MVFYVHPYYFISSPSARAAIPVQVFLAPQGRGSKEYPTEDPGLSFLPDPGRAVVGSPGCSGRVQGVLGSGSTGGGG